ncbi:MAG: hypothetical protein ACI3W5_00600 [Faecousia sp.]
MYKGKYEAPKGAPRPKRPVATRRIEDVPLNIPQDEPQPTPKSNFSENLQSAPQSSSVNAQETSNGVSGSDKLVPMETLSLRRQGVTAAASAQQKGAARSTAPRSKGKKKKKGPTKGTITFYGIYCVAILLFFGVLAGVLSSLNGWLVNYEKSQPKAKSQEIFQQYFSEPDWAALYDLAGCTDTAYEGKEEFVQYMTEKVGSQELRYTATASGDPDRLSKYLIKLGDERIGTFTMRVKDSSKAIKQWELYAVELPVQRKESVTVCVGSGQTVYINGVALGAADLIRTTTTLAEDYLPEGLHGYSSSTYQVEGLLVAPKVEVKDEDGNLVAITYDAELKQYTAESAKPTFTISDRDRETVIAAAKVLSEFRIEAKDQTALARHFDKNSDYYKATVSQDTWMQGYKSYKFSEPVVSEYYVYSEDFFSAHVEMTLYVTRNNGTVKEWDASGTFFFTKRSDGTWIVTDTNKIRLQEEVSKVRLVYMVDDEVITYEMVDAASVQLEPPYVQVPEGKQFAGWYQETVDENGKTVLSLAFQPDSATGLVYLGTGVELEPMVLHARFENEGAE